MREFLYYVLACLLLAEFTVLIVHDHFPDGVLNRILPISAIAVCIVVTFTVLSIFMVIRNKHKINDKKKTLKNSLVLRALIYGYFLLLLVLLSMLGGESQSGFTYRNPVVAIVLLVFVGFLYRDIRKYRKLD